ncbi:hypothetical protein BC629DRAFT_1440959 [Irpex lacteus]|nr:hypothetical protein BC629DRAFT_1440959 [Irpex lacteus]
MQIYRGTSELHTHSRFKTIISRRGESDSIVCLLTLSVVVRMYEVESSDLKLEVTGDPTIKPITRRWQRAQTTHRTLESPQMLVGEDDEGKKTKFQSLFKRLNTETETRRYHSTYAELLARRVYDTPRRESLAVPGLGRIPSPSSLSSGRRSSSSERAVALFFRGPTSRMPNAPEAIMDNNRSLTTPSLCPCDLLVEQRLKKFYVYLHWQLELARRIQGQPPVCEDLPHARKRYPPLPPRITRHNYSTSGYLEVGVLRPSLRLRNLLGPQLIGEKVEVLVSLNSAQTRDSSMPLVYAAFSEDLGELGGARGKTSVPIPAIQTPQRRDTLIRLISAVRYPTLSSIESDDLNAQSAFYRRSTRPSGPFLAFAEVQNAYTYCSDLRKGMFDTRAKGALQLDFSRCSSHSQIRNAQVGIHPCLQLDIGP